MPDYVTAEEAQRWAERASMASHTPFMRLAATVIHQAELLAEDRAALQRYMYEGTHIRSKLTHLERAGLHQAHRHSRAALARLDTDDDL